jgi:hypothetical protein
MLWYNIDLDIKLMSTNTMPERSDTIIITEENKRDLNTLGIAMDNDKQRISWGEVRKGYLKASRQKHPDQNVGSTSFSDVSNAYMAIENQFDSPFTSIADADAYASNRPFSPFGKIDIAELKQDIASMGSELKEFRFRKDDVSLKNRDALYAQLKDYKAYLGYIESRHGLAELCAFLTEIKSVLGAYQQAEDHGKQAYIRLLLDVTCIVCAATFRLTYFAVTSISSRLFFGAQQSEHDEPTTAAVQTPTT